MQVLPIEPCYSGNTTTTQSRIERFNLLDWICVQCTFFSFKNKGVVWGLPLCGSAMRTQWAHTMTTTLH